MVELGGELGARITRRSGRICVVPVVRPVRGAIMMRKETMSQMHRGPICAQQHHRPFFQTSSSHAASNSVAPCSMEVGPPVKLSGSAGRSLAVEADTTLRAVVGGDTSNTVVAAVRLCNCGRCCCCSSSPSADTTQAAEGPASSCAGYNSWMLSSPASGALTNACTLFSPPAAVASLSPTSCGFDQARSASKGGCTATV